MTKYKEAYDEFRKSETFERIGDPMTLKASPDQRQYLENRILRGFSAGWNAAQQALGGEE